MGTPKPSIQWYKDDVEIFACDRIEMREEDEGGAVILKEARLSDSGTIKCVASNLLGRCTSTALFSIEGIIYKGTSINYVADRGVSQMPTLAYVVNLLTEGSKISKIFRKNT